MFIHSSSIGEAQVVPGVCSGQPAATGSDHVSFVVPVLDPVHFKGVLFQMGGDFLGPIPQVQLIRDQALVDDFLPGSAGAFETICFTSSLLSFTSVRMLTVCSKLNSISLMNDSIFHGLLCRQKNPCRRQRFENEIRECDLVSTPESIFLTPTTCRHQACGGIANGQPRSWPHGPFSKFSWVAPGR